MDVVSAVRQALSAPICENPIGTRFKSALATDAISPTAMHTFTIRMITLQ
jgi:hypothetical protein